MTDIDPAAAPPTLPEYASNPFIVGLPSLQSQRELVDALASRPEFAERERGYPAHLRKHCIVRLTRYFEPMAQQVQLAERVGMLLRQGYIGRNPATHDYVAHLHAGAERIEAGSLDAPISRAVENTATSFALLGVSGIGKTLSANKVLHLYPQTIVHQEPFSLIQIVWLRLGSPTQGSPKQLCINFLATVDKLIGTDYVRRYAGRGIGTEQLLVHMAHVAQLHALGVLVVDEIQQLRRTKIGPGALLNFLVTLVDTIGVPVILVGTLGALPILQGNFSEARRASGLGSLLWDRFLPGKPWDYFIEHLWRYQWTQEPAALTPGLRTVLYEESQGILDIVVKLFMLAQLRLVAIGEARKGAHEVLTEALLRRVAREEFGVVRPMLEALRKNDSVAIARYDDLRPLQDYVDRLLADVLAGGAAPESVSVPIAATTEPKASLSVAETLLASLARLGIAADVAQVLVKEALAANPSGDPLQLLSKITAKLSQVSVKPKKPKPVPQSPEAMPLEDLRRIVAEGKSAGKSAHEALRAAGVIRLPTDDFTG